MKLSLMIQVYDGGDCWRECWESAVRNLDLFEEVFVSIGKSPRQDEDAALLRDFPSEKLHWILQDRPMTSVEHGRALDRWAASFDPSGHIFILCHDDILLRDGLLKLREMDLGDEDAAFGPFRFFRDGGGCREITACDFHRDDGVAITGAQYCLLQEQGSFLLSISGAVIPASMLKRRVLPWHFLRYGCRSENCHLCNPYVKRIFQDPEPTVKIRVRSDSEGARQPSAAMQYDNLVYLLTAFATYRDHELRCALGRSIGYTLRLSVWRGLWYFCVLQLRLARLPYYYPAALNVYRYLLRAFFRKLGFGRADGN